MNENQNFLIKLNKLNYLYNFKNHLHLKYILKTKAHIRPLLNIVNYLDMNIYLTYNSFLNLDLIKVKIEAIIHIEELD